MRPLRISWIEIRQPLYKVAEVPIWAAEKSDISR